VRIDGFRGALSSEAELDRLSISDADGEWLILEERAAQLAPRGASFRRARGELADGRAPRAPAPAPAAGGVDLPAPEATPFALPELPVSIRYR
jgi:translocation and assembly module TamB